MESPERAEIRRGLDELKPHLEAYVNRILGAERVRHLMSAHPAHHNAADVQKLLSIMIQNWDGAFGSRLPGVVRSYLHELRDVRNRWAHEDSFSPAEVRRAIETMRLVARAVGVDGVPKAPTSSSEAARSQAPTDRRGGRVRIPTQRAVMRELFAKFGGDAERVIREYAAAERRGEVPRKRNTYGLTPEGYARALFADGEKKGWLSDAD